MNVKAYLSLIISLALTLAPAVGAAASMGFTQVAVVGLLITLASTINVFVAPNLPDAQYVKPVVAFVLAGLLALQQVIDSGGVQALSVAQIVMVVTAACAAIGITAFPNAPAAIRTAAHR